MNTTEKLIKTICEAYERRVEINPETESWSMPKWIARCLDKAHVIELRMHNIDHREQAGRKWLEEQLATLEKERQSIRRECPHWVTTHHMGSGNNDNLTTCDHCGKEL